MKNGKKHVGGKKDCKSKDKRECNVDAKTRRKLDALWSSVFPDAGPLVKVPIRGGKEDGPLPTYTLSHTLKQAEGSGWTDEFVFTINGLVVRSPLGIDAFFSTECSDNQYVNLYTVILPDIPGTDGDISTSQFYINRLAEEGLNVSGIMFKWSGAGTEPPVPGRILNIRHQNIGLHPIDFSKRTIRALKATIRLINTRVAGNEDSDPDSY